MRIENWMLVRKTKKNVIMILPEQFEPGEYKIVGGIHGMKGVEDGTDIVTSLVNQFDGEVIVTRSGSVYELGKKDKTYQKFIQMMRILNN